MKKKVTRSSPSFFLNALFLHHTTQGKKLVFANSWSFGQCVPLDEPVESCREGSDEYAEAMDMCNDIIKKDGRYIPRT